MANKVPFFLTGANAKIKLNGRTVAFATDISYTVEVIHATPQLLGMYEAANIEPLAYRVSGTLTIIRYARNMKGFLEEQGRVAPEGVSDRGDSIGSFGPENKNVGQTAVSTVYGNDGKANQSLDPKEFRNAVKFNIEIFQKAHNSTLGTEDLQAIARLRDCRLIRTDFALSKRTPATQKFAFKAIYLDEDTFRANTSGMGQEFL
jgi:hypothetical protein